MPLSKIADAARKRKERGAEARGQEKVALQSEMTPEAKRSKRSNKKLRMALSNEGDAARAARRAEVREASERSKRIAEASALALAIPL